MKKLLIALFLVFFLMAACAPGQLKKQTAPGQIKKNTGVNPASGKGKNK